MNIRVDSLKENLRDFQFPSRPKFTLSAVEGPLRGEIDLFAVDSLVNQMPLIWYRITESSAQSPEHWTPFVIFKYQNPNGCAKSL
jgi:hypothetical protein